MIFNSFVYILFLVSVVSLYWWLPRRSRLFLLFAASLVFYGFWRFDFVILLLISVMVDYLAALVIGRSRDVRIRRLALMGSLVINLGLLAFFKYYYFLAGNAVGFAHVLGLELSLPTLSVLLPIGISFYTFQSISYTIDVYRGFLKPCRDYLLFANYVMFFPQLIAGPILRANEVIWQLDKRPAFALDHLSVGMRRILFGLFLKVVLADNISPWVDEGFAAPLNSLSAIDVMTLAFMFGFQIYFDFAAYSHIALGSARLMGIEFPENFNNPYIARSPRDFWKRWHISLSSWIRDYLYLPLAGARVEDRSTGGLQVATGGRSAIPEQRVFMALFATWAIMGLWHGAAWAFVLWGLWHACLVAMYRLSRSWREKQPLIVRNVGGWMLTIPLIMLAWIPFRSQSVEDTLILWGHLIDPKRWLFLGLRENTYLIAAFVMISILMLPLLKSRLDQFRLQYPQLYLPAETMVLTLVTLLVLVYLRPINQFIYFQF